jgi:hypothetical protein
MPKKGHGSGKEYAKILPLIHAALGKGNNSPAVRAEWERIMGNGGIYAHFGSKRVKNALPYKQRSGKAIAAAARPPSQAQLAARARFAESSRLHGGRVPAGTKLGGTTKKARTVVARPAAMSLAHIEQRGRKRNAETEWENKPRRGDRQPSAPQVDDFLSMGDVMSQSVDI